MPDEISTNAGSFSSAARPIWPSSSQKPVNQAQVTESTERVAGGVAGGRAGEVGAPTVAGQAGTVTAPGRTLPNVARALTLADLRSHLLNIQIPDSDVNVRMAQLMLKYGVELSRSNFVKLMTMMEGTNMSASTQEAAIALLMKGVDSPEALKILSNYFTQNPQLAAQILSLQESIGNLMGTLGVGKAMLNSSLISQIAAMLSQFDDLLKGLPGSYKFSEKGKINRDSLVNDVRALKALLEGIQEKAPIGEGGESEVLSASLSGATNKLDNVLRNLVSQAIMSQGSERQEVNYQFYQIPNSLAIPPKTLEIIVKKHNEDGQSIVDGKDTQLIMSIDTHNMGKISMVMRVKDKKVSLLFNTESKEAQNLIIKESGDLKQKLMEKDYIAEGFQVKVNPTMCNIRPYLIPLIGLEDLLRINVEA